jgi:(p)ppGpp synthase/HD superfamily hydrolase
MLSNYDIRQLVVGAHRGQVRKYTGEPYVKHLREVARMVADIKAPQYVIDAAWLHDIVEDTGVTMEKLRRIGVSRLTLELVELMTDPPAVPGGPNRAARKKETRLRFLLAQGSVAVWGHTLKAADCLSNAVSIKAHDPKFWKVFRAEVNSLSECLTLANPALLDRLAEVLETPRFDHTRQKIWQGLQEKRIAYAMADKKGDWWKKETDMVTTIVYVHRKDGTWVRPKELFRKINAGEAQFKEYYTLGFDVDDDAWIDKCVRHHVSLADKKGD